MQTAALSQAMYSPDLLLCRLALGLECAVYRLETGPTLSGAEGTVTAYEGIQEVGVVLNVRVR